MWLTLLLASAGVTQAQPQPLGIPGLAIKSLAPANNLAVAPLTIESIRVIAADIECDCMSGCVVLPVKLLSFEGRRINTGLVMLNWKTTNEFQNKGFEVQRSLGNTSNFQPIGFVPAKTTGSYVYEYELPDNNNYSGISYYRLKQVDLDEQFSFSETIAIKGYGQEAALGLYPNPVADKLVADIFMVKNTKAVLIVTDAAQKKLYTQNIQLSKGINLVNIPAAHLSGGIYFVQVVQQEGSMLSAKFIKL